MAMCRTVRCVQMGFKGNALGGYPRSGCVQRGFNGNVLRGCPTSRCNVLRGGILHQVVSRGGPK